MITDALMSPDVMASPEPLSENFRRQAIFAMVGRMVDHSRQTGRSLSPATVARMMAEEPAVARYTTHGPRIEVSAAAGLLIPDNELRDMSRIQLYRFLRPLPANVRCTLRERRQRLKARLAAQERRRRRQQEFEDLRNRINHMRSNHPRILIGSPNHYDADESSSDSLRVNISGSPTPSLIEEEVVASKME